MRLIKGFLLLGLCEAWAMSVLAQGPVSTTSILMEPDLVLSSNTKRIDAILPIIEPRPFGPGEKFKYVIKYEFVAAGFATLEVKEHPPINGRPTFQFLSEAKSNKFIDVFFKVRDRNTSVVDARNMATLSFQQNLREGHYKVVRTIKLDYEKGEYVMTRDYKGKNTTKSGSLNEEPVTDILSAFHLTRVFPLELGESYEIRVFSDKQIYTLKIAVDPKLRTIRVPAGKFECIRIQPFLQDDGLFKLKEGKMMIWMTNDRHRIPVLIRSKVSLGAFDAELQEYDLWQQ